MISIVTVVGARPQFVKAAVVSRAIESFNASQGHHRIEEQIVHTGQHYDKDMSDVFFDEMGIPKPVVNLGFGALSHGAMTGRMLEKIEDVLVERKPDWVLVYGDTNSTLAGALAAAKLHIPVAHVEAGLRSFNRAMPEEINRLLTDHISDRLFAPTATAVTHLRREGIDGAKVQFVGDVMYDASIYYLESARARESPLSRLGLTDKRFVLATVHRAENTDDPTRLLNIFDALLALCSEGPVVIPLHPRTRIKLDQIGLLQRVLAGLVVTEPLGYLDMIVLEKAARTIVTDSGGVQKEAFFFNVPCVTLRDETEWTELVDAGVNRLVPPGNKDAIAGAVRGAIAAGFPADAPSDMYGSGKSGDAIVSSLVESTLAR